MSAFIVSRKTIDHLVTAMHTYVCQSDHPTLRGQTLWNENIASVAHLYNDDDPANLPGPIGETFAYAYTQPRRTLTPLEVYGLVSCYTYQSCEHPGWESSLACAYMRDLEAAIEFTLGKTRDQIRDLPDYDWPYNLDDDVQPAPVVPDTRPTRYVSLTDTAKHIRGALKLAYPTVKFSVRSKSYSGGSSIDVSWTDGPVSSDVEKVIKPFSGASFDGMTDLKTSHTSEYQGEKVRWGTDYVFTQRYLSADFLRRIACKVAAQYHVPILEIQAHDYYPYFSDAGPLIPDTGHMNYGHDACVRDVIMHTAYETSALEKPRVSLKAIARQID
jgi:Large polyvalent protein associated domain 29